jgi:hypothetical protein
MLAELTNFWVQVRFIGGVGEAVKSLADEPLLPISTSTAPSAGVVIFNG